MMRQSTPPDSDEDNAGLRKPDKPLRRGWTTGACATAATKAALSALLDGQFPDPVMITLPKGEEPSFPLAHEKRGVNFAEAGIIKDAGDDPDVTHGAMVIAKVGAAMPNSGVVFKAGPGVGVVTKKGLPIEPGEPAINPIPRQMIANVVEEIARLHNVPPDFNITISVPGGKALAHKTWNPRLGIVGGISILGTTGVVHPFSCAAWIHSIHRGVDVARAAGLQRVFAATGSTSEAALVRTYAPAEIALIDMGDFAGGLLKYLRKHPIPHLTIAGGFAKMTKLAQGHLDLHSSRSQVDMNFLAQIAIELGMNQKMKRAIQNANTAKQALEIAKENGFDLTDQIANKAAKVAHEIVRQQGILIDIIVVDRAGTIRAKSSFDG